MNTLENTIGSFELKEERAILADWMPSVAACTLGVILVALQVLDGVLTAEGINRFGVGMEGNVILRELMHSMGAVAALVFAKSIACSVILMLVVLTRQVAWLENALKVVAGIYIVFAVLPWSFILMGYLL